MLLFFFSLLFLSQVSFHSFILTGCGERGRRALPAPQGKISSATRQRFTCYSLITSEILSPSRLVFTRLQRNREKRTKINGFSRLKLSLISNCERHFPPFLVVNDDFVYIYIFVSWARTLRSGGGIRAGSPQFSRNKKRKKKKHQLILSLLILRRKLTFRSKEDWHRAKTKAHARWFLLIRPLKPPGTEGQHRLSRSLPAGAALLHHLCSVVARQLAEAIVAVDDGPVHDLSISQNKVGVCTEAKQGEDRGVGGWGGQKKERKERKRQRMTGKESALLLQNKTRM